MIETLSLFICLVAAHFAADYPLQTEAIALGKNRNIDPARFGVPWFYWLTSHAVAHAIGVGVVTGSVLMGLVEFVAHWLIDFGKCERWYGIHTDQGLHVLTKLLIAYLVLVR